MADIWFVSVALLKFKKKQWCLLISFCNYLPLDYCVKLKRKRWNREAIEMGGISLPKNELQTQTKADYKTFIDL